MNRIITKFRILPIILVVIFAQSISFSQANEAEAYANAKEIKDPNTRIEAMTKFIKDFPDSHSALSARYNIFTTCLDLNDEPKTLAAAEAIIKNTSGGTQISLFNNIAFNLAEKKMGLDKAKEYIDKALTLAAGNPRAVKMFKDTKALIMFNKGYADSALALEKEAIVGNENDASYLKSISIYQNAAGEKSEALKNSAKAVLNGDAGEPLSNFNMWLKEYKPNEKDQSKVKTGIVNDLLAEYLKDSSKEDALDKNSEAAVFMAYMNQELVKAEKWANEAVNSLNRNSSIDDMVKYKTNLAVVYSSMGKNKEALKVLNSVKEYVDPWNGNFWTALGNIYTKTGDKKNALTAYAMGLVAYENSMVKNSADDFLEKNNLSEDDLTKKIDSEKEKMMAFEPGENEMKNPTSRTVLAELFTGAECSPCVAADLAFDKLSEYYSRKDFIVLEY
ncbi:MAG TPA: hypothetical protein VKA26_06385, partial [Ignavibacteriaceae bacterium]|nr:hypothetical protein [Ignavibacteriaceae bacterium]